MQMVSLLLPLDAADFNAAAGAIVKGCEAALALNQKPVRLDIARTSADPAAIVAAWTAAAGRGAGVIVGPLTRNAVSALATQLARQGLPRIPGAADAAARPPITLALNAPEDAVALPPRFHTFGLAIEQEARAAARMAWSDNHRTAYVVQASNALARRASQAFAAEWLAQGGRIVDADDFDAGTDLGRLQSRMAKKESDMVFLSADGIEARRVRPYFAGRAPVYATSQVNDGRLDPGVNVDLVGIRFVDMPWMMQPDHPAVMVYPRPDYPAGELQRFHALGIDACRLASSMLAGQTRIDLDGVTGRLQLWMPAAGAGTAVLREPLPAVFANPAANSSASASAPAAPEPEAPQP